MGGGLLIVVCVYVYSYIHQGREQAEHAGGAAAGARGRSQAGGGGGRGIVARALIGISDRYVCQSARASADLSRGHRAQTDALACVRRAGDANDASSSDLDSTAVLTGQEVDITENPSITRISSVRAQLAHAVAARI